MSGKRKGMGKDAERYAMTLQEVADALGVTRGCVEQIERRALIKLRVVGELEEWRRFALPSLGVIW